MTAPRRRRTVLSDDSGAVLVLALIVVTVVALVVGGLLSFSGTSLRTTVAMRDQAASAATADAAAEAAINTLRLSSYNNDTASTAYPNCFGKLGSPGTDVNGKTLLLPNLVPGSTGSAANSAAVRCDPDPNTGASGGLVPITAANKPGNAILTLGQTPGEDGINVKALNNSIPFSVRGGVVSNSNIRVTNGSLQATTSVYAHSGCTGTITAPTVNCASATAPDPNYSPETTTVPAYQPVPANAAASCPNKVFTFQPGYYDDAAALSDLMSGKGSGACKGSVWWFTPGVYYFDFQNPGSHQWLVDDGQLIAGTPVDGSGNPLSATQLATAKKPLSVPGACANPIRSTTAVGVQFIFGGDSQLQVDGKADAEICGTYHADRPPIAVYGLKTGTAIPTTVTGGAATAVTSTGFTASGAPDLPTALGAAGDGKTATWTAAKNNTSATLSLSPFVPGPGIPAGSRLSSATLRIVYATATKASERSVTVTPSSGSGVGAPIASPLSKSEQTNSTLSVDLAGLATAVHDKGLTGLTVDYSTTMSSGSSEQIDAILLDLTYTAPALRGQTTAAVPGNCLAQTYTGGKCAVIMTTESFSGQFYIQGTTYTPLAPINLTLNNVTEQVLRFGVVARTLWVKETGSTSYIGPVIEIPDDSPGYGPGGTVVYLTVYVCDASPSCKGPDSKLPDPPVGKEALRVRVYIHDPSGTPQPGSREMTVQAWAVQR